MIKLILSVGRAGKTCAEFIRRAVYNLFQVLKNADFTEGRGPMMPHLLFVRREDAVAYVETQKGIFGIPVKKPDGGYSGWEIKPVEVVEDIEELPEVMEAVEINRARAAALAKLTQEEKTLLGLSD